jgi:hypothetical protein
LFSTHAYGQSVHGEDQFADFNSKGVGLTETLIRFADQQHLPIAIEYVDSVVLPANLDDQGLVF